MEPVVQTAPRGIGPEAAAPPRGMNPEAPVEPVTSSSKPTLTVPESHGTPWAANLGWMVGALGFIIAIYAFYWERNNFPDTFQPSGVPIAYAGIAIAMIGIIVGFVFTFIPWKRPSPIPPNASPGFWHEQASEVRELARASQIGSWIGVGLFMLGMLLIAYVYRSGSLSGPTVTSFSLGGADFAFEAWAAVFGFLALAGLLLWTVYGTRAAAYRNALYAFVAASQPRIATAGPGTPSVPASAILPPSVRMEDVVALMKKIDTLLATLPDETVAQFSKTPEAETYLKLLSGK